MSRYYAWQYTDSNNMGLENAGAPQDNKNVRTEWGPVSFDQRHSFRAYFVHQLTFGQFTSSRLLKQVLGGWQLSAILTAGSGQPDRYHRRQFALPNSRPNAVVGVAPINSNWRSTLQCLTRRRFKLCPSSRPVAKEEIRALGFQYFARGLAAGHANFRIVRVGNPIHVNGLSPLRGILGRGFDEGFLE